MTRADQMRAAWPGPLADDKSFALIEDAARELGETSDEVLALTRLWLELGRAHDPQPEPVFRDELTGPAAWALGGG